MLRKLLSRLAILMLFIFVFNMAAMYFYWYYTIWWFDMPMHFFGGVFLCLSAIFVAEKYFKFSQRTIRSISLKKIIFIILSVMIIGVLWEYFEIIFNNIIGGQPFSISDTISDLFFDFAGASVGCLYVFTRYPYFRSRVKTGYNVFVCQTGN